MEVMFFFENVSDPIIMVDPNFRVVRANPGFQKFFDVTEPDVVGKKSCELFRELDFSQCNDSCARVIERASEGKKVAVPDDHCPHFEYVYPVLDGQGKLKNAMILIKNAVSGGPSKDPVIGHELKENAFSAICHDLASPLQVIRACADVMEFELQDNGGEQLENVRELLEATKRNERRLAEMVRTIRLIPVLEEENFCVSERIRPDEAVSDACSDFQMLLRKDEKLEWYVPEGLPDIMADPSLLNRVFFNLLDNARRYIHAGDRIVVSAQYDPDVGQVIFSVFDNGEAIPPKVQSRISEKNFAVDLAAGEISVRRDHGWGLYFCRLTAERLGGSISVESREGWGTQFTFAVPAVQS